MPPPHPLSLLTKTSYLGATPLIESMYYILKNCFVPIGIWKSKNGKRKYLKRKEMEIFKFYEKLTKLILLEIFDNKIMYF